MFDAWTLLWLLTLARLATTALFGFYLCADNSVYTFSTMEPEYWLGFFLVLAAADDTSAVAVLTGKYYW